MKLDKKTGILYTIGGLVVLGLILAIVLPNDTWTRVLSFFTGFILPAVGGVATLIGVNVGIDKFKQPTSSTAIPVHAKKK